MASSLLFLLLLLSTVSFLPPSTALPTEAISDAADILSDSSFVSMALTLELVAENLLEQSPSATVFAPSDSAFKKNGQPSLDLLRFHFAPLPLPSESLRLLPTGAKIPTMLAGQSLVVTAAPSDRITSLNNVRITGSPLYDDGFLLVYGIDRFFDPNFQDIGPNQKPNPIPSCAVRNSTSNSSYSFNPKIWRLLCHGVVSRDAALRRVGPERDHGVRSAG